MIDVILLEPEEAGNVGAVARVMKNFGFTSLVLVNPKCDHLEEKARNRAKHAQDVLENAKIVSSIYGKYHTLIATTGRIGTDYNVTRSPIAPAQLMPPQQKVGILFGREGSGLRNDELEKCDFIISIPTSPTYPVLNVSHAVCIVLYELFQHQKRKSTDHIITATKKEKEQTLWLINSIIDNITFPTASMRETQRKVWKRIIGKSLLSHREAAALMGFFRRLSRKKS